MKRWLRFFWGMLLVILLAGCSSVSEADIPVDLRYLTGETCSGRLAGTLGNQAAADKARSGCSRIFKSSIISLPEKLVFCETIVSYGYTDVKNEKSNGLFPRSML